MRKKTLIASIIASAVWLVLFIVFIPLACKGVVDSSANRWLCFVAVLVMVWIPYVLLLLKIKFGFTVLIVYLVFIFMATLVGSGFSVYKMVDWYDTVIHFLSGILIGFIGYTLISQNSKSKLEYFWLFIFILAFSMLCGGVWEIYEFTSDCITGGDMQVWQGLTGHAVLQDTMIDLICDFGGSIIAAICCMFLEKNKRQKNNNSQESVETDAKA